MFEYRKLTHDDYEDIVDISKDIWNGGDYLPSIFHQWVDDEGYFIGAVDIEKSKVVAVGKFSILYDRTGWLEGLRAHKDYRGLKLGRNISEKVLEIAKNYYSEGKIKRIAFSTHISNTESLTLMKKLGFKVAAENLIVSKPLKKMDKNLKLEDFDFKEWNPSFEEFVGLPYFKRRCNILPLAFYFQEPTRELYEEFRENGGLVSINGYKGIYIYKEGANFACIDDSFEAIDTFMNYYLIKFNERGSEAPYTSILPQDEELVQRFRDEEYEAWAKWLPDYLYLVYEEQK